MYKISVPIMAVTAEKMGLEKHMAELERLDADRVFLAIDKYRFSEGSRKEMLDTLRTCCDFFHSKGLEVGAWLWTFTVAEENSFVHMTGVGGEVSKLQVCPSDDNFRKAAGEYLAAVAECGVDIIQFDDDFRYGHNDFEVGCACENHMKYVRELLGEDISREELGKRALCGGGNRYRDAWQSAKGHYLELFAKEIREAVDHVNPNVRISLCSCMTTWDMDGTNAARLSRILAGNTKPLLRLIGAPYWAVGKGWGNRLQNIIEVERMELSWCGDDIEVMSEGDVFPRPRTRCPAKFLEIFDTALRASGGFGGILKYGKDYVSNPG